MDEAKENKRPSLFGISGTIFEALVLIFLIGVCWYCKASPTAQAAHDAYSDVQAMQMSDLEASIAIEKYSEYGYTEAQLEAIRTDLTNGIDVSMYTQKGQTAEEFLSARKIVIDEYDEIVDKDRDLNLFFRLSVATIFFSLALFSIGWLERAARIRAGIW